MINCIIVSIIAGCAVLASFAKAGEPASQVDRAIVRLEVEEVLAAQQRELLDMYLVYVEEGNRYAVLVLRDLLRNRVQLHPRVIDQVYSKPQLRRMIELVKRSEYTDDHLVEIAALCFRLDQTLIGSIREYKELKSGPMRFEDADVPIFEDGEVDWVKVSSDPDRLQIEQRIQAVYDRRQAVSEYEQAKSIQRRFSASLSSLLGEVLNDDPNIIVKIAQLLDANVEQQEEIQLWYASLVD